MRAFAQAYLSRRRLCNNIVVVVVRFAGLHVLVQYADLFHIIPAGRSKGRGISREWSDSEVKATHAGRSEATYISTASFSTTRAGVRNGKP